MSKRSRTFLTVITQIRTFSLKLGTSIENFQKTKNPWKDLYKRNKNIIKSFFSQFFRKALRSNLDKVNVNLIKWMKVVKILICCSFYLPSVLETLEVNVPILFIHLEIFSVSTCSVCLLSVSWFLNILLSFLNKYGS